MMFSIFRKKHIKIMHTHEWKLVACNDSYYTNYTDTGETKYWKQRFYECACGDRKHTDNLPDYTSHAGIKTAKQNWLDAGVVPKNSYFPDENSGYVRPPEQEKLDPVLAYQKTLEDIQKALGVVINRDFELETKYPNLKKAADEYHRQLDKYRNFERLKGTENE